MTIMPNPHRRSRRFAVVLTTTAVVALLAAFASTRSTAPTTVRTAAPTTVSPIPANVLPVIAGAAADAGDPAAASTGVAVLTHRQAAQALDANEHVDSDQPVWYVQLHGQFTVGVSHGPPATGAFLLLTIDPSTLGITDFGVTATVHDPSPLGMVIPLG